MTETYRDVPTPLEFSYGRGHRLPAHPKMVLAVPADVTDAAVFELARRYAKRLHQREPEPKAPAAIAWDQLCEAL